MYLSVINALIKLLLREIKLIASRGMGEGKVPRKGSYRCAGTCITCRFFRGQFLPGH